MKVSSVNSSYSAYKENVKQNNNQPNFTALKGVRYKWNFNPKECLEHAEVLLAFKQSKPLKKFFEKYDGFAEFLGRDGAWDHLESRGEARLEIYYNPTPINKTSIQEEKKVKNKNFLKKISDKIKNWFQEDEEYNERREKYIKLPIECFEISSREAFLGKNCARFLKEKIARFTDADIAKELEKNAAETLEKQREAEQLKKIHEKLKDLL